MKVFNILRKSFSYDYIIDLSQTNKKYSEIASFYIHVSVYWYILYKNYIEMINKINIIDNFCK